MDRQVGHPARDEPIDVKRAVIRCRSLHLCFWIALEWTKLSLDLFLKHISGRALIGHQRHLKIQNKNAEKSKCQLATRPKERKEKKKKQVSPFCFSLCFFFLCLKSESEEA